MSVKYKDKLISALSDQIDDKTPDVNKAYSSAYIEALLAMVNERLNNVGTIKPSVKGVVGTKAELDNYDTTRLQAKDIIYVLADETHNGYTAYYRWDGNVFNFIGVLAPYYSPTEIDAFINAKQEKLVSGQNIKTINGRDILGTGNMYVGYYLDIIYPVGSIYTTVDDNFNPNTAFGGRWSQINSGYFVVGMDDNTNNHTFNKVGYYNGTATTITITEATMPAHSHVLEPHFHSMTSNGMGSSTISSIPSGQTYYAAPALPNIDNTNRDGEYDDFQLGTSNWKLTKMTDTDWLPLDFKANVSVRLAGVTVNNTGGSQSHNNLPAYTTVHYWYREA